MIYPLLVLASGLLLSSPPDSSIYADSLTEALVARAMVRHQATDTLVRDYQAKIRYRLSFGFGRRKWGEVPNVAVEEQEGRLHWALPNDLRLDIEGRRQKSRSDDFKLSTVMDEPWFVPRALSDSVRIFGNDFPARAALHPLASDGPLWYRYALVDSVQIATPDGNSIRLLAVKVTPRRTGGALIAGIMWLDATTADVVRLAFRYVGTDLWVAPDSPTREDSSSARRANKIVNRILSVEADLEYALQENKFWMPYRQMLSGRVQVPIFGDLVIPFQAVTSFEDYEINTGKPIVFAIAFPDSVLDPDSVQMILHQRRDSLREAGRERSRSGGELRRDADSRDDAGRIGNGRYEIHRAPGDSLRQYAEWGDSLEMELDPADTKRVRDLAGELERMTVDLPSSLTGRSTSGFGWSNLSDFVRYNRVSGLAPGAAYRVQVPGDPFTTLRGELRFGLSDERLTGALTAVREAPGARWSLRGYRELHATDPFVHPTSLGNSLNAIFTAHDDADYHLAQGGKLTREESVGLGLELTTSVKVDDERSVKQEAASWVNDALGGSGHFRPNPAIREGTFAGAEATLARQGRGRWMLGADVLAGAGTATARIFGSIERPIGSGVRIPTLALRAGVATSPTLPQQAFRLGGPATVRAFDYGTDLAQAFWAAQVDWPLSRGLIRPVVFADAQQGGAASELFSSPVRAGGGAGLSILGGLLRFDLSHPFSSGGHGLRFDVRMGTVF